MADALFFKKHGPYALGRLAEIASADLTDDKGADVEIEDVAALNKAESGHLTFLDNVKYREELAASNASACILRPDMVEHLPEGMIGLLSGSPYKAFALIAQTFYPQEPSKGHIDKAAHIASGAVIGDNVTVEAGAVIESGAEVDKDSIVEAGAVIKEHVKIGAHCRIGANAVISHAVIGNHVNIYRGCCIGQDGFGFAMDADGFTKVPQLGKVIIEDHAEIGANTTIDRGSMQDTVIGAGTWLDNLVQIGHNVKMGRNCVMVAQSGISGSTTLGDFVVVAGQVGIAGHLNIGSGARIAAKSGVMRDIGPGEEHMGYPSVPIKSFMRQIATLNKMIKRDKSKD
ncbi:MAG: UDP-3-O-(3-hydroxymyristoyl)glucosamine N-acyltransferase [Alphaproteobacteria bacterium]|jgi:UDP-3-O-[3-hydroxymyristoyl] glucosamine N-acyltransferase|nr:UDP-3-O-(3-hydroxymyristoyl)glucosamine N-acyltransferase [Alphaproteobacteria bacterium]MDP7222727.1 UDP-3-O-(3-hydroxymyristoyl)glucosamine N-acyltransferase [Alphaproteobacteria bacterium]